MGFTNAVQANGLLYLAVAVSWDEKLLPLHVGDMGGQMEEVDKSLQSTLKAFGAGFEAVIKETVFVTSMDAALAAAGIRREYFASDALPASTWVEVRRLAHPDLLIEVEVVALLPV